VTESERPGPALRLLGSLANVLIDLGLPAIRQWLRDRLGPTADVGQVTTDGALIHLDAVLVPVGELGMLHLSRASMTGLPDIHLHAFEGVLVMRSGVRVDVEFGRTGPSEPGAWVSGELALRAAPSWTGRARLVAGAREWRLEGGVLESEGGSGERIRLAATGVFEAGEAMPVTTAGVAIERARAAVLIDTLASVRGRPIAWPRAIFPDARLRGELVWNATDGARVDIELAADGLGATLNAAMTPSGDALAGEASARVLPARILHPAGAPREAMPRDDDAITFAFGLGGSPAAPVVTGTFGASELGFRFGRPRFVPAVLVRELAGELFVKGGRAVVTANAKARSGTLTLDADADLGVTSTRDATRGTIRANLDAAIARDVLRTLGLHAEVPDDLSVSAELLVSPPMRLDGSVRIATPRSEVLLEGERARGRIAVADALATGLFRGTIRPTSGELAIDVAVGRSGAQGTASARELGLSLRGHDCVAQDVSVELSIPFGPPQRVDYRALRFSAHGGRFVGEGSIPDAPLRLELEHGGIELARTLVPIFAPVAAAWSLPDDLGLRGTLDVTKGGLTRVDLVLETPAGTALALHVSPAELRVRGPVAARELVDLVALRRDDTSTIALDLAMKDGVVTGWLSAERLVVDLRGIAVEASSVAVRLRADRERVVTNPVEATIAGGRVVAVAAVPLPWHREARVHLALAGIAVHDLPPIAGRAPGAIVHGVLSAVVSGRWDPKERPHATGRVRLDRATFPILDRARATLHRYGLRPPSEDATSPVVGTLVSSEWGITMSDVAVDLHGAKLRGSVAVSWAGTIDGQGEVTLEEEYLRTSKVLTLPRALTERLVFPIHVDGTLETPHVKADLGSSLGRFLKDNRVASFVTSAVEEAQILLGQHPMPKPSLEAPAPVVVEDEELRAIVDAYAADWTEIAQRIRDGR
jgi:hypothetical protein